MTWDDALKSKNCILFQNSANELELKRDHDYHHQVQGILRITGRRACDLVYWTKNWQKVVEIPIDLNWKPNVKLLVQFYKEFLLPNVFSPPKTPLTPPVQ